MQERGAMLTIFSKKRKKDGKSMDCSELPISLIARLRRAQSVRGKMEGLAGCLITRPVLYHSSVICWPHVVWHEERCVCVIYKHKKQ